MTNKLLTMTALLGLLVLGSPTAADQGERTDNAETTVAASLSGTWSVESIEIMGMKIDPTMLGQKMSITFDHGKAVMNDGTRREESTYKIDESKTPKTIDITSPNQGNQTVKGIYKLEGNTLKIAFPANGPGVARPTTFDGKDAGILTLKRTKG